MKTLGRIFLIIAAAILLAVGIPALIDSLKPINDIGWGEALFKTDIGIKYFVSFVRACINIGFAAFALIGVLRGRRNFIMGLAAILMIAAPTVEIVYACKTPDLFLDWKFYVQFIGAYAAPIFYFLGFILM